MLLSTYELGHQPMQLAWPLAALAAAGIRATARDLSVEDYTVADLDGCDLIGISVPMHTALRLGVEVARHVRSQQPNVHICFFGLYAHLNREYLFSEGLADSVLAGEFEDELVRLVKTVRAREVEERVPGSRHAQPQSSAGVVLERVALPLPKRDAFPDLAAYARYDDGQATHLAGYTETTRGCLHTCTHCPVVPVYGGRFFAVPEETVLADIQQQVDLGAEHITFGDPDFLNGPTHALRIARALHSTFPSLTFDFTTKVEHLIRHAGLIPELRALGAAFVISAFESTSDRVLSILEKGHARADLDRALDVCRTAGLPVRPTWVAFTPWTTMQDYLDMLEWVAARGLIPAVPAVQFAVRLLVPPSSSILNLPEAKVFGELDAANFSHTWNHPDPRMDELHAEVLRQVESDCGCSPEESFQAVASLAFEKAGMAFHLENELEASVPSPRLTEDWFC